MFAYHSRKLAVTAIFVVLLASFFAYTAVSAHISVKAGNTDVEVGWTDEPPVVGQRNAIVVNIAGGEDAPSIAGLKVSVSYGPDSQDLTLQPLSEDTAGQYIAPIIPTRAGQYTITLSGTLGGENVSAEVQPEEVGNASEIQFPPQAGGAGVRSGAGGGFAPGGAVPAGFTASPFISLAPVLAGLALVVGIVALVLSILAIRKRA
jgi:hypothetical protein